MLARIWVIIAEYGTGLAWPSGTYKDSFSSLFLYQVVPCPLDVTTQSLHETKFAWIQARIAAEIELFHSRNLFVCIQTQLSGSSSQNCRDPVKVVWMEGWME